MQYINIFSNFIILVFAIVGNKMDLIKNRKVPEIEAQNFAKKNNCIFHSTSAANGDGIKELFEKIGKMI